MESIPQETASGNYAPTPEVQTGIERIGVLMASERDKVRDCRFEIGDIFNRLRLDFGPRANYLMERYGEGLYKHMRHCAWVAHNWPKEDRTAGKSWDYFKNNAPGDLTKTKKSKPPTVIYEEYVVDGEGGTQRHCVGADGRRYIVVSKEPTRT